MKKIYWTYFTKPWRLILSTLFLMLCCGFWANAQSIIIDGDPFDWTTMESMALPTYTHAPDPYTGLDDQFTTGAADENFALKAWTFSQVKNKNNIANGAAVLIGTNLYFAGDRTNIEGSAQIGFWFFQNGTAPKGVGSPGDKGYFEPLPAIGDLLVLANFTNGGRNAAVTVYSVASYNYDKKGAVTSWNFKEETNTGAAAAQNNNAEYPVPDGWQYPTAMYPLNAFYEGYVDLTGLVPVGGQLNICFGSFMLETRSSASLTASLDDFVGGNFTTKPEFTAEDVIFCLPAVGEKASVTLCANSADDNLTYKWYKDAGLTELAGTGSCLTVEIAATTTFWIKAINDIGCESDQAVMVRARGYSLTCDLVVNPEPVFGVSLGKGTVIVTVNGDVEIDELDLEFDWGIVDPTNKTNVSEKIPLQGATVTVTDKNYGCTTDCTYGGGQGCESFTVDLECNPDKTPDADMVKADVEKLYGDKFEKTFTASDIKVKTPAQNEGCLWQEVWEYTIKDELGSETSGCEIIYTWKVDTDAPEIKDIEDYMLEACNADWPEKLTTGWTDNCGVEGEVEGDVDSDGGVDLESDDDCFQLREYTFKVTDDCGNEAVETVVVKRKWDKTAPEIKDIEDYMLEACNADWPAKLTTSWTDNCTTGGNIDSDGGVDVEKEDPCFQWRLYTFKVTDECGNEDVETVTVKRKWDKTAPEIKDIEDYMLEACNADWPEKLTTGWTDNCGVEGEVEGDVDSDGGVDLESDDDCFQLREYTFKVTDDCGNEAVETVVVKRKWDKTKPVIDDIDDYMLAECNADWPEKLTTGWTDNCGVEGEVEGDVDSDGGVDLESDDDCFQLREYTFKVTDDCGNEATETVTVKRKWDKTAPVMEPLQDLVFACEDPVIIPKPVFNDNCDGTIENYTCEIMGYPDADCATFEFPEGETTVCFTAYDECGNSTVECIKITVEPCVINCETAFGRLENDKGESLGECFIPKFDRWGWTNYITESEADYVLPLYAGAAHCDVTNGWGMVGTATIKYFGGRMVVTYKMLPDYSMSEVHFYVGCSKYPKLKSGKETVAPGQFTFNASMLDRASEYTITFRNVQGPVWVIAHAVVCDIKGKTTGSGTYTKAIDCRPKSATIAGLEATDLRVYPNPFSTKVNFEFVSARDAQARLEIYNGIGQKIATLMDRAVESGVLNRIEYQPHNVISGVLFYRLTLDDDIINGKLLYKK